MISASPKIHPPLIVALFLSHHRPQLPGYCLINDLLTETAKWKATRSAPSACLNGQGLCFPKCSGEVEAIGRDLLLGLLLHNPGPLLLRRHEREKLIFPRAVTIPRTQQHQHQMTDSTPDVRGCPMWEDAISKILDSNEDPKLIAMVKELRTAYALSPNDTVSTIATMVKQDLEREVESQHAAQLKALSENPLSRLCPSSTSF
ncbi:hypothetical protein QBC45DRAFT_94807 [Copromyces sp. CBS 386.78]|nr:hypothetical protein QBC45DRAFT_94807 [Copromyces sp. CBS 386.78]